MNFRKRMGDCLLLAISKGYDRIVELLLNTDPFKTKSLYKYSKVQKIFKLASRAPPRKRQFLHQCEVQMILSMI